MDPISTGFLNRISSCEKQMALDSSKLQANSKKKEEKVPGKEKRV